MVIEPKQKYTQKGKLWIMIPTQPVNENKDFLKRNMWSERENLKKGNYGIWLKQTINI